MALGRDILCVFCPPDQRIGGGYHPPTQKILLCQNNGTALSRRALSLCLPSFVLLPLELCAA
eukprot:SAG22_NODE_3649_length_1595_cov_2.572193_2_plen_62_part_00